MDDDDQVIEYRDVSFQDFFVGSFFTYVVIRAVEITSVYNNLKPKFLSLYRHSNLDEHNFSIRPFRTCMEERTRTWIMGCSKSCYPLYFCMRFRIL